MQGNSAAEKIEPLAILQDAKVFRLLPTEVLRDIAATARIERYKERKLLVQRGATPEHIRYVVAGGVEYIQTTTDGREAKVPPHRAGEWASWIGCLTDDPLPHDQWSAPGSLYVTFPKAVVLPAVSGYPKALLEAIDLIAKSLRALMGWHFAVSLATDEQRLGQLLFHLGERSRLEGKETSEVAVTHEQMAHLGLGSRQHVAKLLRKLEERGLVAVRYGKVSIRSLTKLRVFAFE
jgi:CRP-like cAMP-binding protein